MSGLFAAEVCALFAAVTISAGNPHYTQDGCVECHLPSSQNGSQGEVFGGGRLVAEPADLCVRCHGEGHKSHPAAVKVIRNKLGLPLDGEGKITCVTCHGMHTAGKQNERPALLRHDFNSLCFSCHAK